VPKSLAFLHFRSLSFIVPCCSWRPCPSSFPFPLSFQLFLSFAEIAQEEDESKSGNVFVTDALLTHLMSCSRSVYPWDVVATYLPGGIIFLDAREAFKFEALSVNETAHVPPSDDDDEAGINSRGKLTEEATFLHQMFSQQVSQVISTPLSRWRHK
jgi:Eukaryotic translation initiation factor 3 subunit 7 (eIF-3)